MSVSIDDRASRVAVPGPETTLMYREAAESADAVRRLLDANQGSFASLAAHLRSRPPAFVVTCARGSSAHAAIYGKYLIETILGVPVASAAPSVASIYGAAVSAAGSLCIAISQSGGSPDLLATVTAHRSAGAHVVALVNDEASPLAAMADTLVGLKAGAERSVAATKSCIAAMAAFAALTAEWADDPALRAGVSSLPPRLEAAWALDRPDIARALRDATSLFVIGRGYGLGIAQEAALKLKETCGLHAEAFSAAEVRHGPMAIVGRGFPIVAFATSDMAGDSVREVAAEFADRGALVSLIDAGSPDGPLRAAIGHPAMEPLLMIQLFYRAANSLAVARGRDPDFPLHLSKVTRTI